MSVVVSDTSPLHYLILCEVDQVLAQLFEQVVIPPKRLDWPDAPLPATPLCVRNALDLLNGYRHWVEKMAHSRTPPGQRILLFRDTDGDGVPDQKTVFLDHLHSPFGVVLVGNDLYVANTDAVLRFPYSTGQTEITAPGEKLCDLPGGPIDHHWTKSLTASPDGTFLYAVSARTAISRRTAFRLRSAARQSGR